MKKDKVDFSVALELLDKLSSELGLVRNKTSSFEYAQNPGTKHRIYVQRQRTLRRIDSTLPKEDAEGKRLEGVIDLSAPNGSVRYQVEPTLEFLEMHLRYLASYQDGLDTTKTRPFSAGKAPPPRKPTPVEPPLEVDDSANSTTKTVNEHGELLRARLAILAKRSHEAKVRRVLDNPEQYGQMSQEEAEAFVDQHLDPPALHSINMNAS